MANENCLLLLNFEHYGQIKMFNLNLKHFNAPHLSKKKISYGLWLFDLGRFSYSHPIMKYQQI